MTLFFWFLLITIGLASHFSQAQDDNRASNPFSAKREPHLSYEEYLNNFILENSSHDDQNETPASSAKNYLNEVLHDVTEWESYAVLKREFEKIRDIRFLTDPRKRHRRRRSSWLYPDDGCFARAQLANLNLLNDNIKVPSKVFVFGNLKVRTPNSPQGFVSWWYHVAPIVKVNSELFVLDPAIEPRFPVTLSDWLGRQHENPTELRIAFCKSGTYHPDSPCKNEIKKNEKVAERDQMHYLVSEYSRLLELFRDPELELGDFPPWRLETLPKFLKFDYLFSPFLVEGPKTTNGL
jgi:hypothetical protein